ncbi:hypothetical protein ACLB2K_067033 [Fragaria x ananassa]
MLSSFDWEVHPGISFRRKAITRYEKEFGSLNYRFRVGRVEFIAIDAQAIDGNPQGYMASSTRAFVKNVSLDIQAYPRVLLTHIPLYRQDKTDCGPNLWWLLIKSLLNSNYNCTLYRYQNYITEESSKYLLDSIQPVLVLSGHDHDQCDVVHESKYGPVKEVSTQCSEKPVLTQLCFHPVQLHIYIWYLSLFVLTVLALLLWPAGGVSFWHNFSDLLVCGKQLISSITSRPKEKDEDLNCEYEMMWDAEGSMHLVKKASNVSVASKSEKISVERGTTVIRPTGKKNISQELEVSVNADVFDPMAKTHFLEQVKLGRSW